MVNLKIIKFHYHRLQLYNNNEPALCILETMNLVKPCIPEKQEKLMQATSRAIVR